MRSIDDDRDALKALYHPAGGTYWKRSDNWLADVPLPQRLPPLELLLDLHGSFPRLLVGFRDNLQFHRDLVRI